MARELSKNPTVLIVNDTIFAHGGVMPVRCQHGPSMPLVAVVCPVILCAMWLQSCSCQHYARS